jgi:dipeptide/tripeptide permease
VACSRCSSRRSWAESGSAHVPRPRLRRPGHPLELNHQRRRRRRAPRNIGSAVGAQVAGTIIATHVLANGLAENAGFTIAFLISAVGAVIAAISVLLIPGHRSRQPAAELRKQASVAARAPA